MTATPRTRIEIKCDYPPGCAISYLGAEGETAEQIRAFLAPQGWTSEPHGRVRDRLDGCPAHPRIATTQGGELS